MKKKNMSKKKICKQWCRTALTTVVSVSALVPFFTITSEAAGSHDNVLTDRASHTDLNFNDFDYYRMSEDDFYDIVDGLDTLCQDAANADAVMDIMRAMADYSGELDRNYTIANLYTSLYADDDSYDEELKFYDEFYNNINDQIMLNYNMVANSPCSDDLKAFIDNDKEWQKILDYEAMTQEQKDLKAQETELSLKYDDLCLKEYTYNANGTDYDMDGLQEAYENGTVDDWTWLQGIAAITDEQNREMGELYLELVDVRTQIAKSYGYENYTDYAYAREYERDYEYADLDAYRQMVANDFVPLQDELYGMLQGTYSDQYSAMWDEPMTEQECMDNLSRHLPDISNDLMVSYNYMVDHDLIDISVSEHKAPGGFTTGIAGGYNAPFLYNCADGTYSDMGTLIHEFGHYNEMYYQSEPTWYFNRCDIDTAEIHSQGLELLFMDYYDDIYGDYADVMKVYTLFSLSYSAVEGVKEDEFQKRVYEDPDNLTVEDLNRIYYDCCVEYGDEDFYNSYYLGMYGLLNDKSVYEWVNIPHTFQSPEYYISYSVSVAAVFELYDDILKDRDAGIDTYMEFVDREFQDGFQDTIEGVGLNNPIKNPRFDLYADDIRETLGLELKGHKDYSDTDDVGSEDSDIIQAPDDDYEEPLDDDFNYDMDGDDDHSVDLDPDTVEKNIGLIVAIIFILAVAGIIVLILLVIIIVLIVSGSKKKKRAAAAMAQYEQAGLNSGSGGYGQPSQNNMSGGYGQTMQGNMNGGYGQPIQGNVNGGYGQPMQGNMNGGYGQPVQGNMNSGYGQPVQDIGSGNPEGAAQNVVTLQKNTEPVNVSKSSEAPASVESAVSATDTAEGQIPATEAPFAENQALQTEIVTAGTQPEQGSLEGSDKKE